MKKENMVFTQSVTYTMTLDKLITITEKCLESVDEHGMRRLKGYTYSRVVRDILPEEKIIGFGKAA